MKALAVKVRWFNEYIGTFPQLKILVERLPESYEFKYQDKGKYHFAEVDGIVRFNYDVAWSSRASLMNKLGFTPSLDVFLTADPIAWARGYTLYAGHVTKEFAELALTNLLETVELVTVVDNGETTYVPTLKGHTWQESKRMSDER